MELSTKTGEVDQLNLYLVSPQLVETQQPFPTTSSIDSTRKGWTTTKRPTTSHGRGRKKVKIKERKIIHNALVSSQLQLRRRASR